MSKNIFVLKKEYEYMLEKLYKENRICLKELDAINNYVMSLQGIYNKAIEYIANNFADIDYMKARYSEQAVNTHIAEIPITDIEKLLDILKGENNE